MDDYGFEKVMVWARKKYIESLIREFRPASVVEVGCGFHQLFTQVADVASIRRWTIIEPADLFAGVAQAQLRDDPRVDVIQGFVECALSEAKIKNVDLCICSGLLHEVEHPEQILEATAKCLAPHGVLHVNVPNAHSFHRQLAVEMGVIESPYQPSDRNRALSQFHVFDATFLRELVEAAGLEVTEMGGYLVKPFTHTQMEKVVEAVGEEVLEGLWHLGTKYPELASEIYLNARRG